MIRPLIKFCHVHITLAYIRVMRSIAGTNFVTNFIANTSPHIITPALRLMQAHIGQNSNIKSGIQIDNASGDENSTNDFSNLYIGHNNYIGKNVFFDLVDKIEIQDDSVISAGVTFITHQDCGNRIMSKWYPRENGPIIIGQGSWIGANATILHGVTLGEKCVVAAGSVVLESFPKQSVIGGVPAKLIKTLGDHSSS